jgi:prepilin-type N-terminal cleavage/methylation domain-containing protein
MSMARECRQHSTRPPVASHRAAAGARGLSIVELLIALAISSLVLAAVTAAIDASFYAYASASEAASTQSAARLVMQRMTIMVRTTTLHDAYDPDDPALTLASPSQPPVQAVGIQMVDPDGQLLRVWWAVNVDYDDDDLGDLWYQAGAAAAQPMLEMVRVQRTADGDPYLFTLASRSSSDGLLLRRATIDLTAEPGSDHTFALETYQSSAEPVRIIASTSPRRNID